MPFPIPDFQPKCVHEPPAVNQSIARTDVIWDRPVFKAPPLNISPPKSGLDLFSSDQLQFSDPLAS